MTAGNGAPAGRGVDLALLAVAVAWGSSYLAAKSSTPPDAVFAVIALRFAIAVLAMVLLLAPRLRGLTRQELGVGAVLGAVLALIFALETYGVTRTSAANAGLIISLTILMTPLLQGWVTGRVLPSTFFLAAGTAVAGVVLLTQADGFRAPGAGDVLVLLAAAVRAVHVVAIAGLTRGRQLDSGRLTLVQLGTVLLLCTGASAVSGPAPWSVAAALPAGDWLLLGYLALACTVLAFAVQTWAVRRTSPARVSLLLGTEPLWAFAVALSFSGQPWRPVALAGGVLVLAGVTWGRAVEAGAATPSAPAGAPPRGAGWRRRPWRPRPAAG
ncbi:DMT family transporter [Blastococcus sp. TF02A-30]|uniref:DMT family transporter n=1 Tax=Blastococcus sp. TF02A-30 TaxID=2250580 RepID=UPI000DE8003A|nr:DMT family transporter [Blastococcus sp. TF02A-30]RBY87681.1 EamA/RhaT family transporter [Blastococcus sp. TF02A-30]